MLASKSSHYCQQLMLRKKMLQAIDADSGTGPDQLPARILKYCAKQLALPVALLAFRIIGMGHWPEMWLTHWIVPIFKRGNVFRAKQYRGVHLTAQLSKVIERLIKSLLDPYLERTCAYGPNQFAYRKNEAQETLWHSWSWNGS